MSRTKQARDCAQLQHFWLSHVFAMPWSGRNKARLGSIVGHRSAGANLRRISDNPVAQAVNLMRVDVR
jgi:hypothetical protein